MIQVSPYLGGGGGLAGVIAISTQTILEQGGTYGTLTLGNIFRKMVIGTGWWERMKGRRGEG